MTLPGEIVTSGGPLFTVLVVVLAVLFGVVSYVRTANFRRRLGRNPWGIHPNVWMIIGFFLGLIGMCLAFLACATTRVGPAFSPGGPPRSDFGSSPGAWAPPPLSAPPPEGPPAGWYPDPSGRHQYRFFTGYDWTADVVDNGLHSTEPLPAPPVS